MGTKKKEYKLSNFEEWLEALGGVIAIVFVAGAIVSLGYSLFNWLVHYI